MNSHDPGMVVWLSRDRDRSAVVNAAPLEVGSLLWEELLSRRRTVVATSATLSAAGNMEFAARRLGFDSPETVQLGSPFDYERAALLCATTDVPDPGQPGYLGLAHAAVTPNGSDLENMTLKGVSLERFADRKALLASFDGLRRDVDADGSITGLDTFNARAFDILTSSRLVDALDLSREDPRLRERYGIGDMKPIDDGPFSAA